MRSLLYCLLALLALLAFSNGQEETAGFLIDDEESVDSLSGATNSEGEAMAEFASLFDGENADETVKSLGDDGEDEPKRFQCGQRGVVDVDEFDEEAPEWRPDDEVEDEEQAATLEENQNVDDEEENARGETMSKKMIKKAEEPQSRITGGRMISATEFPWHVSIRYNGEHVCGGAIIARRYILTSARCFRSRDKTAFEVYLGKAKSNLGEAREIGPFYVESGVTHRQYHESSPYSNDIALVRLSRPITYSLRAFPICLPSQNFAPSIQQRCYVTGFSRPDQDVDAGILKVARVSILGQDQCRRKLRSRGPQLTENMICAGGLPDDNGSTCRGDIGGALVCESTPGSNIYIIQGLVSWSHPSCARGNQPTIYTRVANFYNWITHNAQRLQQQASSQP